MAQPANEKEHAGARGEPELAFYQGKRVLVTGHTGFKGSWLCRILLRAGAEITGYSLPAPTMPNLFGLADVKPHLHSLEGDVRDFASLQAAFLQAQPEIVLHLAAQPLVRESYRAPRETYETNVMGTVNVLECVRQSSSVRSVLNVTTDKVYWNDERSSGFAETQPLDGFDPYSNSKSCSELVTHSYAASFFTPRGVAVSTARAGNVIGGGDFAADRIVPDCVRAIQAGRKIGVRNPDSIRPYQHVLEPLFVYLLLASRQERAPQLAGWYNVGPDDCDCLTTGALVELLCKTWGQGAEWENQREPGAPHEASFLKLDCTKLKQTFGWRPRWHMERAVAETCAWTRCWLSGGSVPEEMDREIALFQNSAR